MNLLRGKYGLLIAVALIVLAIGFVWHNARSSSVPGNPAFSYYLDEETQTESTGPATAVPPLMGKNGKPTVVRAVKYTLDGKDNKILYLEKYTEDAQAKLNDTSIEPERKYSMMPDILENGQWVRSPEVGSQWVPAGSAEGRALMTLPKGPDGRQATFVYPGK